MIHLQLQQSTGNQNMLQHQQNQQQIQANLQLQHHQQQVKSRYIHSGIAIEYEFKNLFNEFSCYHVFDK